MKLPEAGCISCSRLWYQEMKQAASMWCIYYLSMNEKWRISFPRWLCEAPCWTLSTIAMVAGVALRAAWIPQVLSSGRPRFPQEKEKRKETVEQKPNNSLNPCVILQDHNPLPCLTVQKIPTWNFMTFPKGTKSRRSNTLFVSMWAVHHKGAKIVLWVIFDLPILKAFEH